MLEVCFGSCCNGKDMAFGGLHIKNRKKESVFFLVLQGEGAGLGKERVKMV